MGHILLPGSRGRDEVCWALSPCLLDSGLRYTDQGGEEEEDYESEEQLQHRILTAALEFVPAHGWTAEAIAEGAQVRVAAAGWPDQGQPEQRASRFFWPSSEPRTATGFSGFGVVFSQ